MSAAILCWRASLVPSRSARSSSLTSAAAGVQLVAPLTTRQPGAEVIATAGAAKHDFVRGLGADQVVDYRSTDFADVVTDADVVLDTVGGDYGQRSIGVLRSGGLLVTVVGRTDTGLQAATLAAGRRFAGITVEPDHVGLEALTDLVDTGRLRPYVEHTLPLAEAARAHQLVASGRTQGKIVLTP